MNRNELNELLSSERYAHAEVHLTSRLTPGSSVMVLRAIAWDDDGCRLLGMDGVEWSSPTERDQLFISVMLDVFVWMIGEGDIPTCFVDEAGAITLNDMIEIGDLGEIVLDAVIYPKGHEKCYGLTATA